MLFLARCIAAGARPEGSLLLTGGLGTFLSLDVALQLTAWGLVVAGYDRGSVHYRDGLPDRWCMPLRRAE